MSEHDDRSEARSRLWRILTRDIRIPNWLTAALAVLAIVLMAVSEWKRNVELRSRWAAPDRPEIQSLKDTRRQISLEKQMGLEMGVARLSEKLLTVSDKASPERAAHLNTLANAYVVEGEHEKAVPLFQESRDLLETFLGADHPDVAKVDENLRQTRLDRLGTNERNAEPTDEREPE